MILVVASAVDDAAVEFAGEISATIAASVVTCENLALESCALRYPDFLSSTFTIGGREVSVKDIRAVINLLPAVFPDELFFYSDEEREYQAAEFHALLAFFLTALRCPVINRPTSMSLTGPLPSPIGWYHVARKLSIPVVEINFRSDELDNPFARCDSGELLEVGYLHGNILVADAPVAVGYTRLLAEAAKLEYLRARFVRSDGELQLKTVSTVPILLDITTRRALIEHLTAIGVNE